METLLQSADKLLRYKGADDSEPNASATRRLLQFIVSAVRDENHYSTEVYRDQKKIRSTAGYEEK